MIPTVVAERIADTSTLAVVLEVIHERMRQDDLWGEQNHHPFRWLGIIGEEVGEVCRAVNEAHWNGANWQDYRKECIQAAAVLVAMVESMDRNGPPKELGCDG